MRRKSNFPLLGILLIFILSLTSSINAVAQQWIGDGAVQLPGTAGGTAPGWSPTTGGWDISSAIGGQCLACHNPSGGGVGAHDKSSYLLT